MSLSTRIRLIYASEVPKARSMTQSPKGTLFIGTRSDTKVYAVVDTDNDGVADKRFTLASGLESPNGVAFKDGDLYIAEISRILVLRDIENNLQKPPMPEVIFDKYPSDGHHGWKYIAFGPDEKLYVPVGAPCNICEPDERYANITRINADGTGYEVFASGVRNTVGFTWSDTGEMYFTDNGRDMLGDEIPPCELNKATVAGQHFGYPYYHGGTIPDPDFGPGKEQTDYQLPFQNLGPHVAPLGIKFVDTKQFPAELSQTLIFAEHGSWNRSKKIGYRISTVGIGADGKSTGYSTFIDGWLDEEKQDAWGRPVDVLFQADGSMLISDDKAGVIYRVTAK